MSEADDITQALLAGTLGIAQHGLAEVDVEPEPDAPPPRQQHERHGFGEPLIRTMIRNYSLLLGHHREAEISRLLQSPIIGLEDIARERQHHSPSGLQRIDGYEQVNREYTIPPTVRVDNAYLLTPDGVRIDCTCLDEPQAPADQDGPINLVWDVSVGEHVGQYGLVRLDGAWCPRRMILRSRRNPEGESS